MFSQVVGQTDIKERLLQEAQAGRVPHALLLSGSSGCGKLALAVSYAQYLLCHRPGCLRGMPVMSDFHALRTPRPPFRLPRHQIQNSGKFRMRRVSGRMAQAAASRALFRLERLVGRHEG